jgi:type III secretory pathway component EscT
MSEFLNALPAAATSPLALTAYVVAAILFLVAGSRLRALGIVMARLELVPAHERHLVIRELTDSVVPASITPEEWLKAARLRWTMLLLPRSYWP